MKHHKLKRYSLKIEVFPLKHSGLPLPLNAVHRYLSTDCVTRTSVSDAPETGPHREINDLLEETISDIPFIRAFYEKCLAGKLLLHRIEYRVDSSGLFMSFSVPRDLCKLLNTILHDVLERHREPSVTVTEISNHNFDNSA
jgi:hypothetical protein